MNSEEIKRHVMSFMYAERLKSALIIAGDLLDVSADLSDLGFEEGFRIPVYHYFS